MEKEYTWCFEVYRTDGSDEANMAIVDCDIGVRRPFRIKDKDLANKIWSMLIDARQGSNDLS